jgi:hypothetical protein
MNGRNGAVRHFFEGILHGMKAGNTAIGQNLRPVKAMLQAKLIPKGSMGLRQNRYHMNIRLGLHKTLYGALKYGHAIQFQELFRNFRAHSGAASAGHHDKIFFSFSQCMANLVNFM